MAGQVSAIQQFLALKKANKPRGYDFRLLEQDHEVMCSTCQYVLRDPCLMDCCDKKLCRKCLPIEGQPCTYCGVADFAVTEDEELKINISFRKVFCPNEDEGCEWQGEMRAVEDHLQKGCKHVKPMKPKYGASAEEPPPNSAAYVAVEKMLSRSITNSRSKADKPRGYDYRLVEQDHKVMCPTCQYVLRDPCLIGCCGKKVCQQCLPMEGQPCTHCGKANVKIMEDKELKRDILFRKVFCPNEDNGCEWQGEVRAVEDHLQKGCKHVIEPMKPKYGASAEERPSKSAAYVAVENMLSHSKANKPRGYDYRLVEQDHKVMCPTCQYVLRDPCLIGCCGKKVCQQCLPMEGQPCTHCGKANVKIMEDKELKRDISFRKVFCPNEDNGCEWQGEVRAVEDHLQKGCKHVIEPMKPKYGALAEERPSKPAAYVTVENMLSHGKADKPRGYDYRLVEQDNKVMCPTCQYVLRDPCLIGCCGKKVCQQCLPMEGQPCTHCGKANVKIMEDKELKRDISFRKVFCPNEDNGCEWQGEVRAVEDHLQNNCKCSTKVVSPIEKIPELVPEASPALHDVFSKALLDLEARMMSRFDQMLDEVSKLSASSYEQIKYEEISMKCKAQEKELADKEHQVSELTKEVSELKSELEIYSQIPLSLIKSPPSKEESTSRERKIVVESAGLQAGDYCHFVIDEVPLKAEYGRGLNVVVLDPTNYTVKAIGTFDTWYDPHAHTNFREFIVNNTDSFSVICIAAKDEASRYLNNEGKRFIDDLANRTGKIYKLAHRDSYALVAIKDCPQHSAEVISPRDNKRAAHITYCLPSGGTRKLIGFKIDVVENNKITRNIAEKIVTFKA